MENNNSNNIINNVNNNNKSYLPKNRPIFNTIKYSLNLCFIST